VNNIIYESIASRKPYLLLTVAILLLSSFLVQYEVISTYGQQSTKIDNGQQSTVNDTSEQFIPRDDKSMPLATTEPSANGLDTVGDEQSDTINGGSNEKPAGTQERPNSADETTRSSITVDNDDPNDGSGTSQSEEPDEDDDQNRADGDDDQNRADGDDDQNRADGDDDQNRDGSQDSEPENEDENDDENDGNDTPFELPFP
jgi:hypothetical protein